MVERQDIDSCLVYGGQQMILTGQNFTAESKVVFTEKTTGQSAFRAPYESDHLFFLIWGVRSHCVAFFLLTRGNFLVSSDLDIDMVHSCVNVLWCILTHPGWFGWMIRLFPPPTLFLFNYILYIRRHLFFFSFRF